MKYLYSTTELETAITDVLTEHQGHCFPTQAANVLERIVECVNEDEASGTRTLLDLLDDLGDDFGQIPYDYLDLLGACRPDGQIACAQYHRREQALEVTYHPRQPPDPMLQVRTTLQAEMDSGAYIPERLLNAYATILES